MENKRIIFVALLIIASVMIHTVTVKAEEPTCEDHEGHECIVSTNTAIPDLRPCCPDSGLTCIDREPIVIEDIPYELGKCA